LTFAGAHTHRYTDDLGVMTEGAALERRVAATVDDARLRAAMLAHVPDVDDLRLLCEGGRRWCGRPCVRAMTSAG
jgi:hypothetical protein